MSATEHKRVFRRLIDEGFNRGRLAVLDELLAADFSRPPDGLRCGPPGTRRAAALRPARPHLRVDDMAAAGDMTWAAVTVRGTGRAACRVLERLRRSHGAAGDHRYLTDS
jgi:hypothetical protein